MTTILACVHSGLMVADSNVTDADRVWTGRKVWRIGDALIGLSGDVSEAVKFLQWWKGKGPFPTMNESHALVLSPKGLEFYDVTMTPTKIVSGREAIGGGAKAAMCAFEALGWTDPKRAVQIVCKHDAGSRGPVRVYRL